MPTSTCKVYIHYILIPPTYITFSYLIHTLHSHTSFIHYILIPHSYITFSYLTHTLHSHTSFIHYILIPPTYITFSYLLHSLIQFCLLVRLRKLGSQLMQPQPGTLP